MVCLYAFLRGKTAMSKWRAESIYLKRYAGSGAFNTLIGFSIIFALMWAGVSPFVANIAGYAVGFVFGLILSKKIVFRSNGGFVMESVRYLVAFFVAFFLNFVVLHALMKWPNFPVVLAQLVAAGCYTVSMYCLTRFFVFSSSLSPKGANDKAGH